jgi:RNA polymerase sigma factor (sigma-70 family)
MQTELEGLIEQCKANNHKAFEVVYKKYYRVLFGIALRYAGNRTEAEDILQDSFIKIFNSVDSYKGRGSFEGWMKRIVQNTAINNYRSNLKFELHIEVSDIENRMVDDSFNSLFETFDEKNLLALLNTLPQGYRLVLNLYFIDGYSHKEIAEMLNISIGTSKSQLFKAKNYLKGLIETQNNEKIV